MRKKLFLLSLGCPKNLVDSEVMLGQLEQAGYCVVETPEAADLLLVNTCGFIRPAVEESIDEILALAEIKKTDPGKRLVVTGCLVQRYGDKLREELPEVDLFIGTDGFSVERGITTDNVLEAQLYRLIARVADQVVVVADSSKIGNQKLQTILPFEEIHALVTDTSAPTDFVQTLRDKGVNVVLAPTPDPETCR